MPALVYFCEDVNSEHTWHDVYRSLKQKLPPQMTVTPRTRQRLGFARMLK